MALAARKKKIGGSLYDYMVSRGSTFAFVGLLMLGLALGSSFCIGNAEGADLLRSIVANDIALQRTRSFAELIISSVTGFAGIFIFIYICVNSRKGSLLIYAVPLLHGLSVGAVIAAVIYSHGYAALSYILLCIFAPKVMETMLLLSVCNKTARYCKEQYAGQGARKGRGGFPIALYFLVFGIYFVVEAILIWLFRGLL